MFAFFIETFLLGLKNLRLHKLRSLLTRSGHHLRRGGGHHHGRHRRRHQAGRTGADPAARRAQYPRSLQPAAGKQRGYRPNPARARYGLKRDGPRPPADLARIRQSSSRCATPSRRSPTAASAPAPTPSAPRPSIFDVMNLPLARGRYFTGRRTTRTATSACIGARWRRKLFPFGDPLGETSRSAPRHRAS